MSMSFSYTQYTHTHTHAHTQNSEHCAFIQRQSTCVFAVGTICANKYSIIVSH